MLSLRRQVKEDLRCLAAPAHALVKKHVDYYTSIMQTKSDRDKELQMMTIIPLPPNRRYEICGAADGYIFLLGFPKFRGLGPAVRLSLEVKNLKIERVCSAIPRIGVLHPYFGYPPPMSPKVIPSGKHLIIAFTGFLYFLLSDASMCPASGISLYYY